jgi:hypothetical protein
MPVQQVTDALNELCRLNKTDESADDKPPMVIDDKMMGDFFHLFKPQNEKAEGEAAEGAEGASVTGMWGMLANPFAGVSDDPTHCILDACLKSTCNMP